MPRHSLFILFPERVALQETGHIWIDSIAGTSLYKAYEKLKGRVAKTVIVAVIDNGVDVEHEDLKKIIWTNTREIPGNGAGWNRPLFNYRLAHPYSDYGKRNVDLFAPGSDIFSTVPGNGYDFKSGSSMSAPCVSGIAALLFSYFPTLSAIQVKDILIRSSFKPDIDVNRPGSAIKVKFSSLSVSGGIVNAYSAIVMAMKMMDQPDK